MQNKKILIAGGVLVALIGLVALMANKRSTSDAGGSGDTDSDATASIPDLDGSAITSFTVHRPNAEAVTLTRSGETWRVTAPLEADADDNVVRTAIEKLDQLEQSEVVARNPTNHERLEVDDEHGVRVTVQVGDEEVANLIFGASRGGATMVRPAGQNVVLSVGGSVRHAFDRELSSWRNKRVVDVAPERVVGLRYEVGESVLAFARGDEWELSEGEPIERFGAQRVQAVAATLARMRATDFAAADVSEADAGLETPAAVVTLSVGPEPEPEPEPEADAEGDAGVPEGAEDAEAPAAPAAPAGPVETLVLELGGDAPSDGQVYVRLRGAPTIYTISRYSADRLRGGVDLFQDPEPGSEPEPPPPGAAGLGMPGPGGMGGMGGPGGGQIPPELMRQIQEQMRQQGLGQ